MGKLVHWTKPWDRVLDNSHSPFTKWYASTPTSIVGLKDRFVLFRFVGGEINACYNAVDRHVEAGKGSKVALIHDSPLTNSVRKITYAELLDQVSHLAGALAKLGVSKGDRVVIYMPLIPECVIAMLATARLGAVHSVVFGGRLSLCCPLIYQHFCRLRRTRALLEDCSRRAQSSNSGQLRNRTE